VSSPIDTGLLGVWFEALERLGSRGLGKQTDRGGAYAFEQTRRAHAGAV
jgi:hypothetical protein